MNDLLEYLILSKKGELLPYEKASHTTIDPRTKEALNLSQHNALAHAYLTDIATPLGAYLKEKVLDFGESNRQDEQNNSVARAFLKDLEEREPMLNIYERMKKAARSIQQREYMRNPQYPWAYYENRKAG
jgi:hypothetical protein|tara:strand:+ start:188 stop:577 length:390 start_codon:yes stop_codon:yes gene_type:complete